MFAEPFVKRHERKCTRCRELVELICLNGALPPWKSGFVCMRCRDRVAGIEPAELEAWAHLEAQLTLLRNGEAVRSGLETDRNVKAEPNGSETLSQESGEPIEHGGRPQAGGAR